MTVSVSSALLATANAAAASAPDGSKNAAFCGALSTGIGSGYKLVARRDGVIVLSMTMSGSLASSSYGLSIPDDYATLTVLTAADIDTGSWTLRIEKASDAAVHLEGTLGRSGTDFVMSASLTADSTIALAGIYLRSPAIDTPSAPSSSLTLATMKSDVDTSLQHDYLLHSVPPEWDWGSGPRPGAGANPPSGWASAPVFVPWGIISSERENPPGPHNWRVAIHSVHHHERRGGSWSVIRSDACPPCAGALYTDYETNANIPANKRETGGFSEVWIPNTGGEFHFYPSPRHAVQVSGAEHRVVLIKLALTLDNPLGDDDRAAAHVTALAAGDYWISESAGWSPDFSANYDYWIGRARTLALYPTWGWHSAHTMGSDADITAYLAWVATLGIL